jgi:hypothetical protein
MKLLLAGVLAVAGLLSAAPAAADPGPACNLQNQQLCDPSRIYYCPGGGFVTWMGYCPGLVNGVTPPLPGGLPSGGDGDGR